MGSIGRDVGKERPVLLLTNPAERFLKEDVGAEAFRFHEPAIVPYRGIEVQLPAPEGFVFHHLNAFEDSASGEVVVDSIYYKDFPSIGPQVDFREIDFASIPEGQLRRCRIDPRSGAVQREWLEQRCCDFAMVNPAHQGLEARFAWMAVAECERFY